MGLTVVTHTYYRDRDLLKRTCESVEKALPAGATHKVIPCYDNWYRARFDAVMSDDFVVFVDDDDTIDEGGLSMAYDLAKKYQPGVICTDENEVRLDGTVIRKCQTIKSYKGAMAHPRLCHHLCLINRDYVSEDVIKLHQKYDKGIDWFMKTSAAVKGTGIHLATYSYNWTVHQNTMTTNSDYRLVLGPMAYDMAQLWGKPEGLFLKIDIFGNIIQPV